MVAVISLISLFAIWIVHRFVRRLKSGDRDESLSRYNRWRTRHALVQMAAFVLLLYGCGWGWAMQSFSQRLGFGENGMPGIEALILAPLTLMLLLSWAIFYDGEKAIHASIDPDDEAPYGGRWRYVVFQARQNLALVLAPVLVLVFTQGIFRLFPAVFASELAQAAATLPLAALLVVLMPWFVRVVLPLRSLEAGPLRSRLEAAAKRLDCRCSDILLWNTRKGMANAMVVGIVPQLRYVLLSDRLIQDMSDEEIEAVFGHEVGHVKHHHMAYYLAFMICSLAALGRASQLFVEALPSFWPSAAVYVEQNQEWLASWLALPSVAVIAAYIFGVFGFLSRRCERQADVYGCRAVSCDRSDCAGHDGTETPAPKGRGLCTAGIAIFISALNKVAWLNGISRTKPGWLHSWQHSTIAKRVDFLTRIAAEPILERRFQKRVFWIKTALLLAVGSLLTVLILI
jgi:STE24 endopeptidase